MIHSSMTATAFATAVFFSLVSAQTLAADNAPLTAPPDAPYAAVSDLVPLPDFIPGLGQLFVDPDTLPAGTVGHVDMMYNAGHPGVEEPHLHVVLWNIPADQKSRVAK